MQDLNYERDRALISVRDMQNLLLGGDQIRQKKVSKKREIMRNNNNKKEL